jgi:hypothetical protein
MNLERALALTAEAGIGVFAGSVILLHRLRSDLDPATRYISEYAIGPYGRLMTTAFGALSLGSGALTVALIRPKTGAPRSPVGVALLGGFSAGMSIVGLYPTDLSLAGTPKTRIGRIHDLASLIAFRSIALAMLLVSYRFGQKARWRSLRLPGLALGLLGSLAYLWLHRARRQGWPQRSFVTVYVLWLALVARRVQAGTGGR